MSEVIDKNRRFYDEYVADMIHNHFGAYIRMGLKYCDVQRGRKDADSR